MGPVHAGIRARHFRFSLSAKTYKRDPFRFVHGDESGRVAHGKRLCASLAVSGDSTVAHAVTYHGWRAASCVPPDRAMYLRAAMIEMERIGNHLGDIGAICNDAAFAFLHYQFSILREKILRANKQAFGHRLMMDRIVLGGVSVDITIKRVEAVISVLEEVSVAFERLVRIYEDNPSLEDRVYGTGILKPEIAKALGVRRRFLAQADAVGSIPEAEFEALVESDDPPTVAALVNLARRRAGKATDYERRCPHCRKVLRMADSS